MAKKHIVQSNSIEHGSYILVNPFCIYTVDDNKTTVSYEDDLTQHPAILQHPELFEIFEGEIPEDKIASHLNYTPED